MTERAYYKGLLNRCDPVCADHRRAGVIPGAF